MHNEFTDNDLANCALTIDVIPTRVDDWSTIAAFALTFDGYSVWGSSDKCAKIANARKHDTLTQLRTCLFFEQRRWHHFGEHPDEEAMEYIRGLVAKIRTKVDAGEVQ